MRERVMVFLDYQNVYRSARKLFHLDSGPHPNGQVRPELLGEYLAADSRLDRELVQVRIYRGLPNGRRDPTGYGACRRQQAAWERSPKVKVINRPLKYPPGWPASHGAGERPREKGIDVAIAVDFAVLAGTAYDVGILFSTDTDLEYALEHVAGLTAAAGSGALPRAEVAAWKESKQHCPRLSITTRQLYCHWVDQPTYDGMADSRDYSKR